MKDVYVVLRQKEAELELLRKQVSALMMVAPLLTEVTDRVDVEQIRSRAKASVTATIPIAMP